MTADEVAGRTAALVPATGTTQPASLYETHSAVVVFLGDRAYKVKKPVGLGFLDFSTRDRRRSACEREVELNRRLAPDVYLGVADVSGPDDELLDHLVMMRRLPEDRKLARLVVAGVDVADQLRQVARVVAAFHSRCARGPRIAVEGGRDALGARWEASFTQVRSLPDQAFGTRTLDEVEALVRTYLRGREPLFAHRQTSGEIVDGHGDLLAEDIFLMDDGPRILDCIEFDDTLRYVDVLDDAAFLAMDLERLGQPGLGGRFLDWYMEYSGDTAPDSLRHHFLAYRAFVRAKVAGVRQAQGDSRSAHEVSKLLTVTRQHLAAGEVCLVLVGGAPGTGKTTTAGGLADLLGLTLISSDRVRKELAGRLPESASPAQWQHGIYTGPWTDRTYAELLSRARSLLGRGESVVLDASWADESWRGRAAAGAAETSSRLVQLECRLDTASAAGRIMARTGISDADPEIATLVRARFAPWPGALGVDTTASPADAALAAAAAVRPEPRPDFPRPRLAPD